MYPLPNAACITWHSFWDKRVQEPGPVQVMHHCQKRCCVKSELIILPKWQIIFYANR